MIAFGFVSTGITGSYKVLHRVCSLTGEEEWDTLRWSLNDRPE